MCFIFFFHVKWWILKAGDRSGKMSLFSFSSVNVKTFMDYMSIEVFLGYCSGTVGKAFPYDCLWEEGVKGIRRRKGLSYVELWLSTVETKRS